MFHVKQPGTPHIVVVGGGHAGIEAASSAARLGARVSLVTLRAAAIGEMSCNPAIGGLGKGHLVREVDALGGLMGRLADGNGIQFRLLNRRKGPAVRGPRVQCDRNRYREAARGALQGLPGVVVVEGEVADLSIRDGAVIGIRLATGEDIAADAVVLTTGTFLGGRIHEGRQQRDGGRWGDAAATRLAARLREAAFAVGRLKTGTPPRLRRATIDFDRLEAQPGDDAPVFLSGSTVLPALPQLHCHIAHTNGATHDLVRRHLSDSAIFSGGITGPGPRYCPSIEDKVHRFAHKESHQIFLEPEGLDTDWIYPNGISTSLPHGVQENLVRSIAGLERTEVVRAGYAIEYDFIDPRSLDRGLMHREMHGLFLAGQINGTTGYEEAAAQGLVAGANAALAASGRPPFRIGRDEGYIGVLVDDLVTRGVTEPYRMFTSRAEHRLSLRVDNADQRLTPKALALGLVGETQAQDFLTKSDLLEWGRTALKAASLSPQALRRAGISVREDGRQRSGFDLLALDGITVSDLITAIPKLADLPDHCRELLEIEAGYRVYEERHREAAARLDSESAMPIPDDLDPASLPGLSTELQQKLARDRPETIGAARRIEGMTPAALLLLHAACRRVRQP